MQEKIDIRLPRVLDQNMGEVRRPRPVRLSYELNMLPLSKADSLLAELVELTMPGTQYEEEQKKDPTIGSFG